MPSDPTLAIVKRDHISQRLIGAFGFACRAQLRFKLQPTLPMKFYAHRLRLSDAGDLWYSGGRAYQKQTFGYAGRPSNGNRNLGRLLDLSGDVNISKIMAMTFY